jgi:hypothetical protein
VKGSGSREKGTLPSKGPDPYFPSYNCSIE